MIAPKALKFQSTPSVWRETSINKPTALDGIVFQSTPSVWRETFGHDTAAYNDYISIHSLRVEGDYG